MAQITLGGNPVNTSGELPKVGSKLIDMELINDDLIRTRLSDFNGNRIVLNIFPSVNTGVCSASVRAFNKAAADMDNTVVLCISRDLPFAQKAFCAAEGLENVVMLSDYASHEFGKTYGLEMMDGIFYKLLSRVVMVADENGVIQYTEQVPEIGQEPDYESALSVL